MGFKHWFINKIRRRGLGRVTPEVVKSVPIGNSSFEKWLDEEMMRDLGYISALRSPFHHVEDHRTGRKP